MNDTRLLVLAAKALGMPPPVDSNGVWSAWVGSMENGHWWEPLVDDGDAMRIAIALKLDVTYFDGLQMVRAEDCNGEYRACDEDYGDDIPAAVRRAIVRAAAMQASNTP